MLALVCSRLHTKANIGHIARNISRNGRVGKFHAVKIGNAFAADLLFGEQQFK